MKNILIVTHDIPSNSVGATIPFYHMINSLKDDYNLVLVSFSSGKYVLSDVTMYTIDIPEYKSLFKQLLFTLKNMFAFDNFKTRSFFNYYYQSCMSKLICDVIDKENIDLIISDLPMAFYTRNIDIPKIVYAFDAVSAYDKEMFLKEESLFGKFYWFMQYQKMLRYEKLYNCYDVCFVVNNRDKRLLEDHVNDTSILVVANGVDTNYFTSQVGGGSKKLVFLGDMGTPPNVDAILYFYNEIYPLILKKELIELVVVGRNPVDAVRRLGNCEYITVTGEVDDVRKYLCKDSIFIAPMISGIGIKNKILEAMAMELPVITTSKGVNGIDAVSGEHLFIVDDCEDFAECIISLYSDSVLCDTVGLNARLFVEELYSWFNAMRIIKREIDLLVNKEV